MPNGDLYLNREEWAEISLALEESQHDGAVEAARPGSFTALLARAGHFLFGLKPAEPPITPRSKTLRQFIDATWARQRAADEYVPALLAYGLNGRQVEALARLILPTNTRRSCHIPRCIVEAYAQSGNTIANTSPMMYRDGPISPSSESHDPT